MWCCPSSLIEIHYSRKGLLAALTLTLLTWRIWWASNNARRWQIGFNSAFKGLNGNSADGKECHNVWRILNNKYTYDLWMYQLFVLLFGFGYWVHLQKHPVQSYLRIYSVPNKALPIVIRLAINENMTSSYHWWRYCVEQHRVSLALINNVSSIVFMSICIEQT